MAKEFSVIETGRTAQDAFKLARERALYLYGHAGHTGTIAEKDGFKIVGQLESYYVDSIEMHMVRAWKWYYATHKNKRRYPEGIPERVAPLFVKAIELYERVEGPAVCFEITGTRAKEIKEAAGRKGTWDKVFWFGGMAAWRGDE